MISWIVKMLLFWHHQKLSLLDPGVKILYDILTHLSIFSPPCNNKWQNFICLSYLLEKMYCYRKIILMIFDYLWCFYFAYQYIIQQIYKCFYEL